MKKGLIIGLFAFSMSLNAFAQQELRGYLVDVLCGDAGYPEGYKGQIDLTVNPEKNIVACLVMDNCKATGFGLSIAQGNGGYAFYRFDKESNQLVGKQVLPKLKDKMAPAPYISLIGTLTSAGEIRGARRISIAKAPSSSGGGMGDHKM